MKDIQGKRGLKGEPGLRGKEGTDALCFCSGASDNYGNVKNVVNTATSNAGIAIATPVSNNGNIPKTGTVLTRASDAPDDPNTEITYKPIK